MKTSHKATVLRYLLLVTTGLFLAGLTLPIMTLTQFMFFEHSFSVLSGIWQLWQDHHPFLFVLVGLFSVLIPIGKLILLFVLLHPQIQYSTRQKQWLHLMHDYGRWAMLDVMVVAMLIITVKLGVIATIEIHPGLYLFGSAVLLIMFITHQVVQLFPDNTGRQ